MSGFPVPSGTYVSIAPAPSGGDDTAALQALFTGTKSVWLVPGATYQVALSTAWPAFSGKVLGNGATISFNFAGTFSSSQPIAAWTDVVCEQVIFTGPAFNMAAIFGPGCARLTFRDCGCFDLKSAFSSPITSDLVIEASRWYQSGSPPATINQAISLPSGGRFVFERNKVDFAPVSASGAILAGASTTPTAGSSLRIVGNTFFESDLAGYTVDGAIDIEPAGTVQYDEVTIEDNKIFNASCYLSGAKRINVHRNFVHFTTNNVGSSHGQIPFIIHNSNGTKPATGVVDIFDNEVIQDTLAVAQPTELWHNDIAATEIRSRFNRLTINPSTTGPAAAYLVDGTIGRIFIEGDVITGAGATTYAGRSFIQLDQLPSGSLIVRNLKADGKWFDFVGLQSGTAQTVPYIDVQGCDLTAFTIANTTPPLWLYNNGNGTATTVRIKNTPGVNPLSHTVPQPAVPASTVTATNTTGVDCTVYAIGGTVSAISVDGAATGLGASPSMVRVPAGSTIALTYTVAPTWQWFGD